MGRKIVYTFVILGVLILIAGVIGIAALTVERRNAGVIPEHTILEADFSNGLIEYVPEDPIAKAMSQRRGTVRGTTLALRRAARDERVHALVARVGGGFRWPGKVQEVRDAVLAFRASGKRAIAYVEDFPFGYAGTTNYYLASAFDEIHMLPIGGVTLAGLALEVQFLRGTLDKLDVEAEIESRWEYKTAASTYTDTELSAPNREAYERIVESQFERIRDDIARDRAIVPEEVDRLAGVGWLSAPEALDAGLVDRISYRDEVFAAVAEQAPEGAERLYLGAYYARSDDPPDDAPVLALVYGVGAVVQGPSRYDPLSGSVTMGSDTVAKALRDASADEDVRAILFRIDSGGGSAVASQIMWRETLRAQQKGKPVIASMSDVAGSGGYYVAMGADKIVAQPGTITGSIGVLAGKLVTKGLWDKLGVSFDGVETHPNAAMWSGTRGFTPEQRARFHGWLDRIYAVFTEGVAEGRNMPLEKVLEVAKGRIWTGADAQELGLVDSLGGFEEAIRLAKEAAGIDADEPVQLRLFPRPKTSAQLLIEQLTGQGGEPNSGEASTALMVGALEALQPLSKLVIEAGLLPRQALEMELPIPR